MTTESNQRFSSLDIVRGLAALSIFLTHWGRWVIDYAAEPSKSIIEAPLRILKFIWQGGGIHPGVIVFIVLSGFCIHLPQARSAKVLEETGFWKFYAIRRAVRILPIYWVALLFGILSTWIMSDSNPVLPLAFSFSGVAEIARFFVPPKNLYPGNRPLSTVAVEILLYASYPLFIRVYQKRGLSTLLGIGLLFYSFVGVLRYLRVPPALINGTYFEFVIYWLIGALCAHFFYFDIRHQIVNRRTLASSALLVAVYLILTHIIHIKGFHVVTTLLLAIATGVTLVALLSLEFHNKLPLANGRRVLAFWGERSYSLYVIHTPMILLTRLYCDRYLHISSYVPWIALIITLLAAEFIFKAVEAPSHRLARRLASTM